MEEKTLSYEEAAELRTGIEGWVCKTCRRFYGDNEHIARYCCAKDRKCETEGCQNRTKSNGYIVCDPCCNKKDHNRWLKLKEVEWDGETPLVLHDDDQFFFSADDLEYYLEEHNLKVEDLRLVVCEEEGKPLFDMYDLMEDYLPDGLDHDDATKINAVVNRWIEKHVPVVWTAGDKRPSIASVAGQMKTIESPAE